MRSRAYRRHHRARIKARHLRDLRDLISYRPDEWIPKDIAVRHPLDCGRRCYLCHYAKLWGLPRAGDREWLVLEEAAWGDLLRGVR